MVEIVGKKCKLKLIPTKLNVKGTEILFYTFEIQDEKFMAMLEQNFKNYVLLLPQTPLRMDVLRGKILIYIDASGIVTHVTKG